MYVKPSEPTVTLNFHFQNGDIHQMTRVIPIGQQKEPDKFAEFIMTEHLLKTYIKFGDTMYPTRQLTRIVYVSKE